MRLPALFFAAAALAFGADPPKDVGDFFVSAVRALADQDSAAFLDHFDRNMPGFAEFRGDVIALVDRSEVVSTVGFVTDDGDDSRRILQLDWYVQIDDDRPERQIVKCTIERQGKKWKIVSFEPLDFFKPRP
ncbi:MAG TPA: hypothetical protein VGN17_18890 [Bryobacteraceae bacterium]